MVIWIGVYFFIVISIIIILVEEKTFSLFVIPFDIMLAERTREWRRKKRIWSNAKRDTMRAAKKSLQIWWHFYVFFFFYRDIYHKLSFWCLLIRLLVCLLVLSLLIFRHIFFPSLYSRSNLLICVLFFLRRVYVWVSVIVVASYNSLT